MNGRIMRAGEPSRLSIPRVGKIKIGMKNQKGYPMSVDYFIPSGKYAGLFTKAYGEKPNTIQVVFPDDDASKVCNEEYEYRNDEGRLLARGDGKEFEVWNGKEYQKFSTDEYPELMNQIQTKHPNKLYKEKGDGWRVRLTLNFIIPCVRGIFGVWTFETNGSASTIPQVRDAFDAIAEKRGGAKGVIFDLSVKFAQTQKPGDKSRFPVVSLVPNESEESISKIKAALEPIKQIEQ